MSALLEVEGLLLRFGGVIAADHLSFAVASGELLGLIGPNGAGKTTVLRLIAGLLRPEAGRVRLGGVDVTGQPTHRRVRRGLGLTHQLVRPFHSLTVVENVMIAAGHRHTRNPIAALARVSRIAERRAAEAILVRVGLADSAARRPAALPLGQRKRLELARALALEPTVLLLDEPMAGLSSAEAAALGDTILALNTTGTTIVLVEHNLGEVMRLARRLLVLDTGRAIADGPPDTVMRDPAVQLAYVGTAAG
ncbi:MAG: ABC transporter ATP-binding protein [Proteobacteria bacterium]|nr:ABC transporter ATP-binding protein [Pseudomonadota bacterium]